MDIPYNPEVKKDLKPTQELPKQVPNKLNQPPVQEEIQPVQEELLIGIYLKKDENSIDYNFNSEQIDLILFNKNLIAGLLESIKLDILIGDKQE